MRLVEVVSGVVGHSTVLGGRTFIRIHRRHRSFVALWKLVLDSHLVAMSIRYWVRKADIIVLVMVTVVIVWEEHGVLLSHAFIVTQAVLRKL